MSQTPRFRLYQFPSLPLCKAAALALKHAGVPHETVDLVYGDATTLSEKTRGSCLEPPLLEDVLAGEFIHDTGEQTYEVARYIDGFTQQGLFDEELAGEIPLLCRAVESSLFEIVVQICDSLNDMWIHTDVERGLMKRMHMLRYGRRALDDWTVRREELQLQFVRKLDPFNKVLKQKRFLLGNAPTWPDYLLYGALQTTLHPSTTSLTAQFAQLSSWFEKMVKGEVPTAKKSETSSSGPSAAVAAVATDTSGFDPSNTSDLEAVVPPLKLGAGRVALDVGTGAGFGGIYLAKLGLRTTLCDQNQAALDYAKNAAAQAGVAVSVNQHSAEQMPYPDQTFDLVLARRSTHYFQNPRQFVDEAFRVLKTYGSLILIDGFASMEHPEVAKWIDTIEKLRDPAHVRYLSRDEWQRWLEYRGMRLTHTHVETFRMPDLNWYLDSMRVPPDRRVQIEELAARAPQSVREVLRLSQEGGRTSWNWRRATIVAQRI